MRKPIPWPSSFVQEVKKWRGLYVYWRRTARKSGYSVGWEYHQMAVCRASLEMALAVPRGKFAWVGRATRPGKH